MSNSRIILQAVGDQDKYLTIGAKSTLFKTKHKRHTLFGKDWNIINSNYKNSANFAPPGSKHYFRIENNGDLINDIYLRIKVKCNSGWKNESFGIKETILEVGSNFCDGPGAGDSTASLDSFSTNFFRGTGLLSFFFESALEPALRSNGNIYLTPRLRKLLYML